MAVFQKETGLCTGRGFAGVDATGYLARFMTWVVKDAGSGGPAWTILLDKSTLPVAKSFIVDSTGTSHQLHTTAHGMYTGETIQATNSGGALPAGISAATDYYIYKIDADHFRLCSSMTNCWAGTGINVTGSGTGTQYTTEIGPYIVVSDQAAPTINQSCMISKVGYRTSVSAEVRVQMALSFDTTNKILYGFWSGYTVTTLDSADFSYDFRGGAECMILQSRIGTAWTNCGIDGWTGDTNFVEGTDKTGTLTSAATAGSSVILQLNTGQAANFTVNKYYYIYDMNGHAWVNYCKVTNVNTGADQITVDSINQNFPIGSVIAAYTHRWYTFGSNGASSVIRFNNELSKIPYCSALTQAYVFPTQNNIIKGAVGLEAPSHILTNLNNDDEGYQACCRGLIFEYFSDDVVSSQTPGMNRSYGTPKNIYFCIVNSMAAALDGKVIGGKNYLYFKLMSTQICGAAGYAFLLLDTTATS
jgi:hypothetical protein